MIDNITKISIIEPEPLYAIPTEITKPGVIEKGEDLPEKDLNSGTNVYAHPYDMSGLSSREQYSTTLGSCLDVMVSNTVGFGWRLVEKYEIRKGKVTETLRSKIEQERRSLTARLEKFNMRDGLYEVICRFMRDLETVGNGYVEVVRAKDGSINGLNHIPAAIMWISKIAKKVKKTWPWYVPSYNSAGEVIDYIVEDKKEKVRFNRFIARRDRREVFFKEFGDPRSFRGSTEIIWRKLYRDPDSKYGIPRYIGALLPLLGAREAEEINYNTFKNNCVPNLALLVSGGAITQGSLKRIKEFLTKTVRGNDNYSRVLLIEAESSEEFFQTPQQIKIRFEKLREEQHTDELFQEYIKHSNEKIRRSFRLPPLYDGGTQDFTRATAESARRLTDEQVFSIARKPVEFIFNNLLFPEMGVKYHKLVFNTPSVIDNEALMRIAKDSEKTGAMSPRIAREMLEDILNREIPWTEVEGFNIDRPMTLSLAEAVKNLAEPNGQNVSTAKMLELKMLELASLRRYFVEQEAIETPREG